MKRFLTLALLLAWPLAAQTPTPTITPTRTPTPTPIAPSRYSLATQVRPGFGTFSTEATLNKLGDTYCAVDARTFGRIAGNTTTTRQFSISLGTGSVSACPVWGVLVSGDIPNNAANTTGSAAKWTTARSLAGNSVDGSATVAFANKFIVQGTTDAGLSGPQFLGALGTGIVKNTTTTGVLSIAAAADLPSLLTTKGDVLGFSTVPGRLGIGTDGWVLTADAASTFGFKWAAATGGGVSVTTKGDLQTFSTVADRLAVGTDGYVLSALSSEATGLKWIAASGTGTVTSIATTAPITGGTITTTGTIGCATMGASGAGTHAPGCTPDTSASSGTTKFLREDASWQVPAGGGTTVATKGDIQTFSTVAANLAVGADGKVLVASSAAATGLAYAGGLVQISKITTAASQTTVDFPSIPANFTDLVVIYQARSQKASVTTDALYLEVNADGTSTNYTSGQAAQAHGTSWDIFTNAPATTYGAQLAAVPAATGPTSFSGTGRMTISNYLGTAFFKDILYDSMFPVGTANYRLLGQQVWKSTSAITRLTFSLQGTAFVNGSVFTLYGIGTP